MNIQIRKAERRKSKLRLGLAGPSGAGKTMSALKLAKGIADGIDGRICMIDTERGSGDLYAHLFDYDIITLTPPYKPDAYTTAIAAAEKAGYQVIVIDSLSHAWSDEGGLLDQADKLSVVGNRFTVWADLTPQHRKLVNAILNSPAHIIATMRSKQAYELQEYTDSKGNKKSRPVKMGLAPVQREGMEYEFTVFMDIEQNHNARATKDRTDMFRDEVFIIDEKVGERILNWLNQGKDEPAPASVQPAQQEAQPEEKPKPARVAQSVEDIQRTRIKQLIKILGLEVDNGSIDYYRQVVKAATDLDPVPENYSEIISRLEVLAQERKAAAAK